MIEFYVNKEASEEQTSDVQWSEIVEVGTILLNNKIFLVNLRNISFFFSMSEIISNYNSYWANKLFHNIK